MPKTLRKNATTMTPPEWAAYTQAVWAMAEDKSYQKYIRYHAEALNRMNLYEGRSMDGAHRCPAFLPWHRAMLIEFEADLQKHGCPFLPVWDWENSIHTPFSHLGGNGVSSNNYLLGDLPGGPHGEDWTTFRWTFLRRFVSIGGLSRRFDDISSFPKTSDFYRVLVVPGKYDVPPFNYLVDSQESFRNALETLLHNPIHNWVGGHMEEVKLSVNDPLFFLHHANVDRFWFEWQKRNPDVDQYPVQTTRIPRELPPGQAFGDKLRALTEHIDDEIIKIDNLDYEYVPVHTGRELIAGDTLTSSIGAYGNEELRSPENGHMVGMQGDGNLVIYSPGKNAFLVNKESVNKTGGPYTLTLRADGILEITNGKSEHVWKNIPFFKREPPFVCIMQNDGNFVVYGNDGPSWGTQTNVS